MLQVTVGAEQIAISGEMLGAAIIASMPGFLQGGDEATMQQRALRSALSGLIPMALGMMHKEIVNKQLPVPAPDLRCPAARANMIGYAVNYLIGNFAEQAEKHSYQLVGERDGDTLIITGITATDPALDDALEAHRDGGEQCEPRLQPSVAARAPG